MITFYGDCDKHDFVLATASIVNAVKDAPVVIITDNNRNYRYLSNSSNYKILGIGEVPEEESFIIYDCYRTLLPSIGVEDITMFTDLSRPSLDSLKPLYSGKSPNSLVISDPESKLSRAYLEEVVGDKVPTYTYYDSVSRRTNLLYEERLNFKRIESSFKKALGKFMVDQGIVKQGDINKIFDYLKRRG